MLIPYWISYGHGHHGNRWIRLNELAAFCQRPGAEDTKKDIKLAKEISNHQDRNSVTYSSSLNKDNSITIQHVKKQIAALQIGDYEAAFNLNSPANKKRLVSSEKFKAIVSGWAAFKVLTLPATICNYREGAIQDTTAHVKVEATAAEGEEVVSFVFDLSRNGNTWETDGVRI